MHNELPKMDLKKMQEELDYRRITLRPQLLEEVKVARSFGDLSENFEYHAAQKEKNANVSGNEDIDIIEGKTKTINKAVNYNSSTINIGSNFNSYS